MWLLEIMALLSDEQFSLATILKNVLALMFFVVMACWGVSTIAVNPRSGWIATILFGTMGLLVIVNIVRVCGADAEAGLDTPHQHIRATLVQAATGVTAIVLGVADSFIAISGNDSFPRPMVWLGTFLTTLAFYPLRGEVENEKPNFPFWTGYAAVLGVVSVGISYLSDWLETIF